MTSRTPKHRVRSTLMALGLFGSLAGILLYSKLRLATNLPRSAYAVPEGGERAEPRGTPRGGGDPSEGDAPRGEGPAEPAADPGD